jgi:hypothetical protein
MVEAQEFLGWGRGNDPAGLEQDNARGEQQGFVQIVCDEYDRLAEASSEGAEFLLKLGAGHGIERAKRLVHQQDRRIGGEGAGHANALALAAGEFAGVALREFAGVKADEAEHFLDPGGNAGGFPAFQNGNEGDIFRNREMGEETRILNDVANATAEANEIPIAGRAFLDKNFARRGVKHPIDQLKEGGLAAAAAAEKNEGLTLGDFQADAGNDYALRNIVYVESNFPKLDFFLQRKCWFRIHFD